MSEPSTDEAAQRVRVLVPRGGRPGRELADALTAAGLEPVVAPLISFRDPDDVAPLREGLRRLADGAYGWLVLTSERTVDALVDHGLGEVPERTCVAVVGPSTGRRARAAGLRVDVTPAWDRTATGLLAALRDEPPAAAFAPRSSIARPELVDGLRAAGWTVDAPDAYVTETATGLPDDAADVDVVVLTSSSTAETWTRVAPVGAAPLLVSIGPRTTETAAALGQTITREAATPDVPALVAAVRTALARSTADARPWQAGPGPAGTAAPDPDERHTP